MGCLFKLKMPLMPFFSICCYHSAACSVLSLSPPSFISEVLLGMNLKFLLSIKALASNASELKKKKNQFHQSNLKNQLAKR